MIRPLQTSDFPDVLALLQWMDDDARREVLAPDARDLEELRWENEGKTCLVSLDELGGLQAYCALAPFRDGVALEGPLGGPSERALRGVLREATRRTGSSVYAFCAAGNGPVRAVLEREGFATMHTTDFSRLSRREAERRLTGKRDPAALPPDLSLRGRVDPTTYRALYRSSEDAWSERLGWSAAALDAHFARDDVRVLVLTRGRQALGFAELEIGELAQLTYLAVHPAERGHGHGTVLLGAAVIEALRHPEVRAVQARAHDHEAPARSLYAKAGFTPSRSVLTYVLERD